MNLSNNVMKTTSFGVMGVFENPMRMTANSARNCVHEHVCMGPDKEASTLSTGS